ncbi:MAG TPA: DinB family protein [Bryobacteraceae bacterium]|nr:DinB family protein [Bryobacteraceae bacterium]
MPEAVPEPWLRGPIPDVHPLIQPAFFTFAHVREDLARHCAGLTHEQVWRTSTVASLGFHLKHLAGSVDRLTTYLVGSQLSEEQLRAMKQESHGGETADELLQLVEEALAASERRLRELNPESLYDARAVGRKRLPTTVIGLLVHLSEHTQRHLGQAVTTAKLVRDTG